MIAVVDASAAAAFLLAEPEGAALETLLEQVRDGKARVIVPGLFWYEMINVILLAGRKGGKLPGAVDGFLQMLDELPFDTDPEITPRIRCRIADVAQRHHLTAYDAAYVELAHRLKARSLKTFDRALLELRSEYSFLAE